MVDSEGGALRVRVPRDQARTFTRVWCAVSAPGRLDAMIISLYAGGMTVRNIQHHLASTLSVGTISKVTDAVADAVHRAWRRPLEVLPGGLPRRDSGGPR